MDQHQHRGNTVSTKDAAELMEELQAYKDRAETAEASLVEVVVEYQGGDMLLTTSSSDYVNQIQGGLAASQDRVVWLERQCRTLEETLEAHKTLMDQLESYEMQLQQLRLEKDVLLKQHQETFETITAGGIGQDQG
jgi:hypothetical protein